MDLHIIEDVIKKYLYLIEENLKDFSLKVIVLEKKVATFIFFRKLVIGTRTQSQVVK